MCTGCNDKNNKSIKRTIIYLVCYQYSVNKYGEIFNFKNRFFNYITINIFKYKNIIDNNNGIS